MEIRRYQRGEENAVWQVYFTATRESIARDYHADLIERWAPCNQDMGQWATRLAQTNPFVAIVDGEVAGMAEIDAEGFIDYFYVHPKWQGRGVGKALLAALETESARLGVCVIWANVSLTAKAFFLSKGFCITDARSNVILGHPAPNFRMEKTLGGKQSGKEGRPSG